MRTSQRRFKVDKLFVLGAGASFSATRPNASFRPEMPPQRQTPLDRQFTAVLEQLKPNRPAWVGESVDILKKAWKDHVPFRDMGLEEAIIAQSANMQFVSAIRPRRSRNPVLLDDYLNHVAHLAAFCLRRAREGKEGTYSTFFDKFFSLDNHSNRIITFNYDDVLDARFLKATKPINLYFSKIQPRKGKMHESGGSDFPIMLKLHGSVNWNCSSEDFLRIIGANTQPRNPLFIENIWFRSKGVPSANDDQSPCIIPPVAIKPVTTISLFRFLWTRACEYLHECKEIVICGYSLPPTDALAGSLFKEFSNQNLERIVVVDPNPSMILRWRRLLTRPNVKSARWEYFSDFAEFVKLYQ